MWNALLSLTSVCCYRHFLLPLTAWQRLFVTSWLSLIGNCPTDIRCYRVLACKWFTMSNGIESANVVTKSKSQFGPKKRTNFACKSQNSGSTFRCNTVLQRRIGTKQTTVTYVCVRVFDKTSVWLIEPGPSYQYLGYPSFWYKFGLNVSKWWPRVKTALRPSGKSICRPFSGKKGGLLSSALFPLFFREKGRKIDFPLPDYLDKRFRKRMYHCILYCTSNYSQLLMSLSWIM